MLNAETKRKIDNARDILVGKIPVPTSQVEQITLALIYKVMSLLDEQSRELGDKTGFFEKEYKKYSWSNIMDKSLSAHERVALYGEGLEMMSNNPNIPQLFRDIFKGAFLPFRDPEILKLFLDEIDGLEYNHTEDLGDAFEYLLSIMGSQGDAGQFRTPRHIIKFIVDVVDPKKEDKVLDPACGTAGFLVSAYKHILENNLAKGSKKDGSGLTPDDREKLMKNFVGYDVSHDMVRLSLVNMYLHKFPNPQIYEYDTLTSQDRWDDDFDCILANPPFMTPKGGIRPHNRFSIQAKRSEVLFVDYIMEHLTNAGKAGVIVPEGIIFQSSNAYKDLRKMLVDDGYLWAVVSLPAGVFNPYSGVKTSILLMDKTIARKSKSILFVKVENDGFDLGAQRREIDKNDLPLSTEFLLAYKGDTELDTEALMEKLSKSMVATVGKSKVGGADVVASDLAHVVEKQKIQEIGDYNLSGERYRETVQLNSEWPIIRLGEILDYEQPKKYIVESENYSDEYKTPVLTAGKTFILGYTCERNGIYERDRLPVIIFDDFTTATKYVDFPFKVKSSAMKILTVKDKVTADIRFVYYMMQNIRFDASRHKRYWIAEYSKMRIPLPPLNVQKEIVEELDEYQRIIDGARMVVENWKPRIKIDPEWEMVELGEVCEIVSGQSPPGKYYNEEGEGVPFYQGKTLFTDRYLSSPDKWTTKVTKVAQPEDILMSVRAPVGPVNLCREEICIGRGLAAIRPDDSVHYEYLFYLLRAKEAEIVGNKGAAFDSISRKDMQAIKIPLPPHNVQKEIVEAVDRESQLVDRNKKLLRVFRDKINDRIDDIWGK